MGLACPAVVFFFEVFHAIGLVPVFPSAVACFQTLVLRQGEKSALCRRFIHSASVLLLPTNQVTQYPLATYFADIFLLVLNLLYETSYTTTTTTTTTKSVLELLKLVLPLLPPLGDP